MVLGGGDIIPDRDLGRVFKYGNVSRQTFNQLQLSLRFLSAGTSTTTFPSTITIILPSFSYHPVSAAEPKGYKPQVQL